VPIRQVDVRRSVAGNTHCTYNLIQFNSIRSDSIEEGGGVEVGQRASRFSGWQVPSFGVSTLFNSGEITIRCLNFSMAKISEPCDCLWWEKLINLVGSDIRRSRTNQ